MSTGLEAAVQAAPNEASLPARSAAMPQRILIIEDGCVLAKNMKTYLSGDRCDVRTAADATQALQILDSFAPDALVLDYGLPDVDGLRTYAEIVRRQARKIDGVMMTGAPNERLSEDARRLGINHVIGKPFRFSELRRLLETCADSSADACA